MSERIVWRVKFEDGSYTDHDTKAEAYSDLVEWGDKKSRVVKVRITTKEKGLTFIVEPPCWDGVSVRVETDSGWIVAQGSVSGVALRADPVGAIVDLVDSLNASGG